MLRKVVNAINTDEMTSLWREFRSQLHSPSSSNSFYQLPFVIRPRKKKEKTERHRGTNVTSYETITKFPLQSRTFSIVNYVVDYLYQDKNTKLRDKTVRR